MQKARQYELIYIVAPESTEEMVADLQTQVEDVVSRFDAKIEKTEANCDKISVLIKAKFPSSVLFK